MIWTSRPGWISIGLREELSSNVSCVSESFFRNIVRIFFFRLLKMTITDIDLMNGSGCTQPFFFIVLCLRRFVSVVCSVVGTVIPLTLVH